MINYFYSLPFAMLINPLLAVPLAQILSWPLVPAIDNLFYKQAFLVMTVFVWLSAFIMQSFNLFRHLFENLMREQIHKTLTTIAETKQQFRLTLIWCMTISFLGIIVNL